MDWEALLRSTVIAAAISGVVAFIGFFVSSVTARKINQDKLELDEKLATHKAAADLALAERKVELDRALALARRRAEVAEKTLADFYRIERAFEAIRSPMIWAGEMQAEEGVEPDVIRNEGYGVIRRFRQYADLFSELEVTRFTCGALFGPEAHAPFQAVMKLRNRVYHAADALLRYRNDDPNLPGLRDFLPEMRRIAFAGASVAEADQIAAEISAVINTIERICRPALESEQAAEAVGREI